MAKQSRWNRRRDSGLWLPTLDWLGGSRRATCRPFGPREFFIPGCAPCCTPIECEILNDTFTRSDSSSLGSDWTEVSGDWEIASNALKITTTSNAICNAVPTADAPSMRITVNVQASATSAAARVIVNYTDSNNYWFAEWVSGTGTLKLYTRSGGTNTQVATVNVTTSTATNYEWVTCVRESDHLFYSTINNKSVIALPASAPSANVCGVGTGTLSSGNIQFADFLAENVNDDCETCSARNCNSCEGGAWPNELTVTISGVADDSCASCDSLWNGTFVLAEIDDTGCPQTTTDEPTAQCAGSFTNNICTRGYMISTASAVCAASEYCPSIWAGVASCFGTGHYYFYVVLALNHDGTPTNSLSNVAEFLYDAGTSKPDCTSFDLAMTFGRNVGSYCDASGASVQLTGQI